MSEEEPPQQPQQQPPEEERIWLKFRETVENTRPHNLHNKDWVETVSKASFKRHSYRKEWKLYHYLQQEGYEDRQVVDWGVAPPKRIRRH